MRISGALFEQKRSSFDNLTQVVFLTKGELFYKNQGKLIFSRFTQKLLQIHDGTKNGLNMLSL